MELLIVIVILGVLAGVAMPIYTGMVQKAQDSEVIALMGAQRMLLLQRYAETGAYNILGQSEVYLDTVNIGGVQGFDFEKWFTLWEADTFSIVIQVKDSPNCFAMDQTGTITSATGAARTSFAG